MKDPGLFSSWFTLWQHQDIVDLVMGHKDLKAFGRGEVLRLSRHYLERPWMQCPELDWVFVDSLVAAEFDGWIESQALGEGMVTYFFATRDRQDRACRSGKVGSCAWRNRCYRPFNFHLDVEQSRMDCRWDRRVGGWTGIDQVWQGKDRPNQTNEVFVHSLFSLQPASRKPKGPLARSQES